VELIAGEVRSDRRKGRNKIVLLFLGIALWLHLVTKDLRYLSFQIGSVGAAFRVDPICNSILFRNWWYYR
jgi:hypothetical protein